MSVKEQTLQYVSETLGKLSEDEQAVGLTARQVAEGMGIWQNDAAAALNSLCADQMLRKVGSRPIHYCLPLPDKSISQEEPIEEPAFHRIIGATGSLALQIQLAKAGASYPPNGMHMLLIGESGVGKTLLAEEIWRYMNQNRPAGTKEKPFIIFNCAEYAENPQFLLSQLFGYIRGAFTGADTDHPGLVSEADGGVLFLDEIHRLPATGQEMLFTLLDRGMYRSLGSSQDKYANLMVIGATTENPEAALLNTFRRRIPMVIEIPTLQERPIKERLALVLHFIQNEAQRLNLPIRISPYALRLLAVYHSNANIGDLKNEIQLCCARGYLDYRSNPSGPPPFIEFGSSNLSRNLQNTESDPEVEEYLDNWIQQHSLIISPEQDASAQDTKSAGDLYGFIEERIGKYSSENLPPQEIGYLVSMDLIRNFSNLSSGPQEQFAIFESVTSKVRAAAEELIRLASNRFNCTYPEIIYETLALFLQQLKFHNQVNQAYPIPDINFLAEAYTEKLRFVKKIVPMLERALNVTITDDEATVIAMLLETYEKADDKKMVGLIIMGHGKSTASSIADFVNQVLLTKIAHAVDVYFGLSPEQAMSQLCALAKQTDEGKGVIVLTDSENIEYYEQHLKNDAGIRCRVIPGMSTAMALELCKSIITTDDDIDTIFRNSLASYQIYMTRILRQTGSYLRYVAEEDETAGGKSVILTCCITGTGCARRIREYLLQFPAVYMNAEIIPIGLKENIYEMAQKLGSRLKLVIGFTDPKIKGVPFLTMENITSQEGINRVTLLLKGWKSADLEAHWSHDDLPLHIRFEQLAQRINYFAPTLDPEAVAVQADFVVAEIRKLCTQALSSDLQVRIYIHIAAMFDRLNNENAMPMPEDDLDLITNNYTFYQQVSSILDTACRQLSLELQPSEVYYFLLTLPLDEMR